MEVEIIRHLRQDLNGKGRLGVIDFRKQFFGLINSTRCLIGIGFLALVIRGRNKNLVFTDKQTLVSRDSVATSLDDRTFKKTLRGREWMKLDAAFLHGLPVEGDFPLDWKSMLIRTTPEKGDKGNDCKGFHG